MRIWIQEDWPTPRHAQMECILTQQNVKNAMQNALPVQVEHFRTVWSARTQIVRSLKVYVAAYQGTILTLEIPLDA